MDWFLRHGATVLIFGGGMVCSIFGVQSGAVSERRPKPTHEMKLSGEQTIRGRGVCEPAREPRGEWEGSRTRGQDFKKDLGNSAVPHYRWAFENVATVEMRTQLAIERAGLVTPLARRSSIPTVDMGFERNGGCDN
jgi:hypothetical protein